MNSIERRALAGLSSLYVFRMLGLFMLLPVLSLYGTEYTGATPMLLGVALGAYGLSQALLQIPLGMLSDRLGRKPVIFAGLAVFALGSVVAATSDSVWGVIAGRVLQGAGAIAGATMALLADVTRDENRGKAMAAIGAAIGLAFMLAVLLGPALAARGGLEAIFWASAGMALAGMLILWRLVPTPFTRRRDGSLSRARLRTVLASADIRRLVTSVFFLHLLLTALFVPLPVLLVEQLQLPADAHWKLYAPVMLLAFVLMLPGMIWAEKRQAIRLAFCVGALGLGAGFGMLLAPLAGWVLVLALLLFFVAFNLLEALLPAQLTRVAPVDAKGTASGVYATLQFLGAFVGGVAGGWLYGAYGYQGVALFGMGVVAVWLLLLAGMRVPAKTQTHVFSAEGAHLQELQRRLAGFPGVVEIVAVPEDCVAYVRARVGEFDVSSARAMAAALPQA
ncbi:MFS transporter [Biformimicrobium ophioploci]|uniref:MFS transporter n=1 Tax=Biformimicrobium ophioploci TaxID=3036711 RepID=A0ABQ6M2P6_9GAMM|nr:MFS transporter [Microbulbifer sp. NKW57]GMG88615.1 MFS transporter [Microbulbifer sp. NKW57]